MNNIQQMAAILKGFGRGGDTMLAHINPEEAMLLNEVTDGGTINRVTGMPEFFFGEGQSGYGESDSFGSYGDGMDDVDMGVGANDEFASQMDRAISGIDSQNDPYGIGLEDAIGTFAGPLGTMGSGVEGANQAGDVGASMSVNNIPNVNQPSLLGAILSAPFETLGNVLAWMQNLQAEMYLGQILVGQWLV